MQQKTRSVSAPGEGLDFVVKLRRTASAPGETRETVHGGTNHNYAPKNYKTGLHTVTNPTTCHYVNNEPNDLIRLA